jgi:3-methyl-2-oxobutanoate hydroxymethyltransferase
MAHIGLTPQTANKTGGFRVRGKEAAAAAELIRQARMLEKAGVFSLVIECVPSRVSRIITKTISVPTIGIGAGRFCDGQVLVLYDMLGLYKKLSPKFVRLYADIFSSVQKAAVSYSREVKEGSFPSDAESFHMRDDEYRMLLKAAAGVRKKK